jgi:exosome complex component RRP41
VAPFSGGIRKVRGRYDRRTSDLQILVETAVLQCIVPDTISSSEVQISITIIEADGSIEACAANAAIVAVADAGIFFPPFFLFMTRSLSFGRRCMEKS